ncbi:MAG TPA: GAF domain-containing sensor histidine kinase [bacterium]|nr:GAF domain-containing sensor histidine kinase [bacterium]
MATPADPRISDLELDLAAMLDPEHAAAPPSVAGVCERVLARAIEATPAEAGSIFLVDTRTGRLVCAAAAGEKAAAVRQYSLVSGRGVLGLVAESAHPILTTADDPRHDRALAERIEYPVDELLCVPILDPSPHPSEHDGPVAVGVIELLTRKGSPRRFSETDVRLVQQIAERAAKAIDTGRILETKARQHRLDALAMVIRGVVHDVRNPLTFINGYAEALADESDPDRKASDRDAIFRNVDDINEMLRELAEFASGDETTHRAKTNVRDLVHDVVRLFTPRADGSRLKLRARVQRGLPEWSLDTPKVRRVLCNLVKNAIEATPAGGSITVSAFASRGTLHLWVRDSGKGIPRDVMSRLFEPFVTRGKKGGTGLGLSICRRFAEAHGGEIDARTREGHGTRFVVRIPAV